MAGNISLEGSIRTCKVDPAYAPKVFSDRFLNPCNMVCPVWNGYDTAGRPSCPDSFMTKREGCNSAEDRIYVENELRPKYIEYVNLSQGGIDGEFYGSGTCSDTMTQWNEMKAARDLAAVNAITGNFGLQFDSSVYPNCGVHQYTNAMAQNAQSLRKYSAMGAGYKSQCMKLSSGM